MKKFIVRVMLIYFGILGVFATLGFIGALFEGIMDMSGGAMGVAALLFLMVVFGWYGWLEWMKEEWTLPQGRLMNTFDAIVSWLARALGLFLSFAVGVVITLTCVTAASKGHLVFTLLLLPFVIYGWWWWWIALGVEY
jgi:hypothetical protein